jgi:hypothetical protein
MKRIALSVFIAFSLTTAADARNPKPIWDTAVRIFTGGGAAFGAAQSAEAQEIHAETDLVLADLRRRGIDPTGGAIFQLYFEIDPASAGRWFLSPNVYALVQIEGQGDFVPASIAKGYRGQPYTVTVYGRQVRPGGRILVHLLDDKQFFNAAWNSLLQTEVPISVAGQYITPMFKAEMTAEAKIKILNKDITFQPPGYMATADIKVPSSKDGIWLADGRLTADNKQVGVIQFGQIWVPNLSVMEENRKSKWSMIFWGGIAVVFVIVFLSQFANNAKQQGAV